MIKLDGKVHLIDSYPFTVLKNIALKIYFLIFIQFMGGV